MKLTVEIIKERFKYPLPGEAAHIPLSPSGRGISSETIKKAIHYKESAVALILFEERSQLNGILMQRQVYKGFHSGQVCFPGGKKEDFETNLSDTAIRETIEEIGLQEEKFNLLGELTPVFIPVSNFKIQPFVVQYTDIPLFNPDVREVKEVFSFPIEQLIQEDAIQRTKIQIADDEFLDDVPYFNINGKIVWGATALILNEFRDLLGSI